MLEVASVAVGYGRADVLREASLRIQPGELVTLVGANGAGKTTLLRAIMGIVPLRAGRVLFEGRPIHDCPTEAIVRRGIAMVPEGRELFAPLTVRDNLVLGAYAASPGERRGRLAGDLERVLALFPALPPRLRQAAGTLSGGEQQMVAIARALMARPRLLLLDEPSVGLAPLVIREIFRTLAALKAEGLTMLLVEQNARAAFRIADRGYVLGPSRAISEVDPKHHAAESARRAYGLKPAGQETPS